MIFAAGSKPDIYTYALENGGYALDNDDVSGLTRTYPGGEGLVTEAFMSIGNSVVATSVKEAATQPIFTSGSASQIRIISGRTGAAYQAIEPLINIGNFASARSSVWLTYADLRISAGRCSRVVFLPIGVPGSSAANWRAGAFLHNRALAAYYRLASLGYPDCAIHLHFGENESSAGGSLVTSFRSDVLSLIAALRNAGATGTIYLSSGTAWGSASFPNGPALDADIAAIINGTNIKSGANLNDLGAVFRWDSVHLSFNNGRPAYAAKLHAAVG